MLFCSESARYMSFATNKYGQGNRFLMYFHHCRMNRFDDRAAKDCGVWHMDCSTTPE